MDSDAPCLACNASHLPQNSQFIDSQNSTQCNWACNPGFNKSKEGLCVSSAAPEILVKTPFATRIKEWDLNSTLLLSLVLSKQPDYEVLITIVASRQLDFNGDTMLKFPVTDWNITQNVSVRAADDATREGNHSGLVTFLVSSSDERFDGISVNPVSVQIEDNDCDALQAPDRGYLRSSGSPGCGNRYNDTCTVSCDPGFVDAGGVELRCLSNSGKWDKAIPTCDQCAQGYFKLGSTCVACSTWQCGIGFYRGACGTSSDAICEACTGKPRNALFTTTGQPSDTNNCSWACNAGYWKSGQSCVSCSTSSCPAGEYRGACAMDSDAPCLACNASQLSQRAVFVGTLEAEVCHWECSPGYNKTTNMRTSEETSCRACPLYSNSSAGAQMASDCLCKAGYAGRNGSICRACSPGHYKDWSGEGNCTECSAGKYSNVTARSADCTLCISGKYSQHLAQISDDSCLDCPLWSTSLAGSAAVSDCLCNAGYVGPISTENASCTPCVAGKFKAVNGSEVACTDCEAGKYSLVNASVSCALCPAGKYSEFTSANTSNVCITCPANTTSGRASSRLANCLCIAGFTGANGSCTQCLPGTFKDGPGPEACSLCPASTYSVRFAAVNFSVCKQCPSETESAPGSSSINSCTCLAGYEMNGTLSEDGSCRPCLAGKFKTGGNGTCKHCPLNSWSDAGSTNISQCKCALGYHGLDGSTCLACAAGKYKPTNGSSACQDCGQGKYMNSSILGAVAESSCAPCSNNSYSPGGSNSSALCVCRAGYTGDGISSCTPCEPSTFKSSAGSSACSPCKDDSNSPPGSTDANQCVCNVGYTDHSSVSCLTCPAGTYKESTGSMPCTECESGKYGVTLGANKSSACFTCPGNSTSNPASSSVFECICVAGHFGPDGGQCAACGLGTYKSLNGSRPCTLCSEGKFGSILGALSQESCQSCSPFTTSPAGSSGKEQCSCIVGFTLTSSGCTMCAPGTYKNVPGDQACDSCPQSKYGGQEGAVAASQCSSCPAFSQSPAGSAAAKDCLCAPGYTFALEGCSVCPRGSYKDWTGNENCRLCNAGTYSVLIGATRNDTCTPCPQFTTSAPGSSGSWECLCLPGYTRQNFRCVACGPGKYKERLGNAECSDCEIGKFSSVSAQTSEDACTECPQVFSGHACLHAYLHTRKHTCMHANIQTQSDACRRETRIHACTQSTVAWMLTTYMHVCIHTGHNHFPGGQ